MNTAHNGQRLGQALFKICMRLDIVDKVCILDISPYVIIIDCLLQIGHITCDNASNNGTMLHEFARCYKGKTRESFDDKKQHIR